MIIFKRNWFALRLIPFFVLLFLITTGNSSYAGYQTNLLPGTTIQDETGNDLKAGGVYSIPVVFDWNGDGLNDLIVGTKGGGPVGLVTYFENIGSSTTSPAFDGTKTRLEACNGTCGRIEVEAHGG